MIFPIVLYLSVLTGAYFAFKLMPVLCLYIGVPGSFALGTWYIICTLREREGLSNTIINSLCSVYIIYVWFVLLKALDKHLQGAAVIPTEGVMTYWQMLGHGAIGVVGGFLVFLILRLIDHWEERIHMRRTKKYDAYGAEIISGPQPGPHGVSE